MRFPGDDIVEEKAFELAVRDPVFRKERIHHLAGKVRTYIWGSSLWGVVALFCFFGISKGQRTDVNAIFPLLIIASMIPAVWRASRNYNEAKLLKMLEIQANIAASRTTAP